MKIKDLHEDMSLLDLISAGTLVAGGVAGHIGMDKYLQWKAAKKAEAEAKAKREAEAAERARRRNDPELIAARRAEQNARRRAARARSKEKQAKFDALAKDVLNPYATKKKGVKPRAEFVSGRARPSEVPDRTPVRRTTPSRSSSTYSSPSFKSSSSFSSGFGGFKGGGGRFGGGGATGSW